MSCVPVNDKIEQYASQFKGESVQSITNLLGLWYDANPLRAEELPSVSELEQFKNNLRRSDFSLQGKISVPYRLPGQNPQNYYVEGDKIFNKEGKEVFKEPGKHRNRVMANAAVMTGTAVVVTYKDKKYVVHNDGQIISVATGDIMKWGVENGDRKAIIEKAEVKKASILSSQKSNSNILKTTTIFSTSSDTSYRNRTKENADWSDITIALAEDFTTAGERLTKNVAGNKYVSYSLSTTNNVEDIADSIYKQILDKGKTTDLKLNIAGNGIYTLSESQEYYNTLLTNVIKALQDKGITISTIRSGGQTGIDEAGIKAAQRLGIPSIVHTTSDYKFRDKNNKDISDEAAFKARFNQQNTTNTSAKIQWARTAENSYEVSTQGDSRFSALKARFKPGTIIDGIDVSNMTIKNVYQSVIKKSGKGKAPSKESKLYNPELKTKSEQEDFSYREGYFPLWQEWAKQNPELIQELREKSAGKVLTDKFAVTRVSQARALAEILNSDNSEITESIFTDASIMSDDIPEETAPVEIQDLFVESDESSVIKDFSVFEKDPVAALEAQQAIDLVFDPITRRDRVTLISRLFSNEISKALKEKQDVIDRRMMEEDLTKKQKEELTAELYSLDRFQIIKSLTPKGIFDRVKAFFESYNNDTEDNRVQAELAVINRSKGANKYSDEVKLAAAKKNAEYKFQEYQKIIDYFNPLADEASRLILKSERIKVSSKYAAPEDADSSEDTPEGESVGRRDTDIYNKEELGKDIWMSEVEQESSFDSLSQAVRKVISEIPKLDYKGKYDKDDLGNTRYLDAEFVHATLIDKLKDMTSSEDMMPLLEELSKTKTWVKQVIKLLNNDDVLFSQFYSDFRKDFVEYWIQKKIMHPDGTFNIQTICINKPEGTYYLLDSWRDNYESGTILDDDSIYEKNGEINKDNAKKGLTIVEELNNLFQSEKTTQERLNLIETEDVWNKIVKTLNMIGINPNPAILRTALTNIKESPEVTYTDPILLLLPQLNIIFKGAYNGEVKSEIDENGMVKRGDLINTFGSAYNSIALLLNEVIEDAIESSTRENNKSYYSHIKPSYLGKLIKKLKNVRGNEEEFNKYIQKEFKQYDWFYNYKDGVWKHDWLEKLATDPSMRKALQYKNVLNHDKIPYTDWTDLDYTIVLLNEYWADPKEGMAWYYVPILSDSPAAEFIKFKRYTTGSELDENNRKRTYQDIILDKMLNIINQEYDRIMLVRERDARFIKGEPISLIEHFDISRKEDTGDIESLGGAEFKFFPELNDIRYENGESFLSRMERLRYGDSDVFRQFLRDTLEDIMEKGFESTYSSWFDMGLFEELPNGKFKYIPFEGQSRANQKIAKALNEARTILKGSFTSDMEALLNKYSTNKPVNDKQADAVFNKIKDLLNEKASRGELANTNLNYIIKDLVIKNNSKEALREYYWNSKFATSQIIELTTTDLAFYKNLEDFQKRFKEIYAPSQRLNTNATFHGKPIGRKVERTIYLKDYKNFISNTIEDLRQILYARMNKVEADYIISQFKSINVADAQAYRSLSSYRSMMGMMGQWTDEMETAYEHLKNGTWNTQDFTTIWQPKKPFVYTQINNRSGVPNRTGMKTPTQHKNSEFLLLALYETIAGPLGKSGKLRAINDFMEKHNIDVVQFESAVKVGKQGTIDINVADDYEGTMAILEEKTGIVYGEFDPNVVHEIDYEDYGIQTETPEHGIDAVQLVGTQIRKLISADLADDILISVGGITLTKKEWLDLYNKINTENILQAFKETNEIFKDPKEVERVLLEEIRSSQRYGIEMERACTLVNGVFNIPFYDPIQSQRIQTLLNSIIKNRITKQKIRGGALIQATSYGVTDDLNIVYEGKGKNKRIKYFECYMPAYSRKFFEPLMDERGQLDINKLPEDLRELIGYRVPTEDKYSMLPLRIKGFLPLQCGTAIMLPAEITKISGSDFDIDKLYIMLPEFVIKKHYNIKAAWDDFYKDPANADIVDEINANIAIAMKDYIKKHPEDSDLDVDDYLDFVYSQGSKKYLFSKTATDRFSTWFKTRKQNYFLKNSIEKIKYDYNKLPQEQSLKARNNALIDLMWGVLTNPDTAPKILTPGNFDKQRMAARTVTILESMDEIDLKGSKFKGLHGLLKAAYNTANIDYFDDLIKKTKHKLDPLSPLTQVILHQQNMTGNKMIGIYANYNANHAIIQHTDLALDEEYGAFKFGGEEKKTSLHEIKNDRGEFISSNNANYLDASVDNVKDNTLYATNQNPFTGDVTMLLSNLGYHPVEIALLMKQPIIMEFTRKYFRESKEGKSKDIIIEETLKKVISYAGMYEDLSWNSIQKNTFEFENLAKDIMLYKKVDIMSNQDRINFYRRQAAVGVLFKRMLATADAYNRLVSITRADTPNGAAGPTIAATIIKIEKFEDFLKDVYTNERFPLINADVIWDIPIDNMDDIDSIRKLLLKCPLPYNQAFYTLGVKATEKMLSKYFPHFTESFKEVLDGKVDSEGNTIFAGLRQLTKTGRLDEKTINSIYNDLLAYIMSKLEFFGDSTSKNGKLISSAEKRKFFINQFPAYFNHVISENEDIAQIDFIKRLKTKLANNKNPVGTVVFKNVGNLKSSLRERFSRDWEYLLHMKNPKAQELALNLMLYSYYRNGFAFGPSTFIHLAPIAIRKAIDGYIFTLRSLLTTEDSYREFMDQYIYNHLDNRKFVPEIPDTATTKFVDGEGNVQDMVTITIDGSSTYGDKTAIRKERKDQEGNTYYEFFKYIGKKIKGRWYYYRLSDSFDPNYVGSFKEAGSADYVRIEPLGYKSSFLEYEYGKEASDIETVIDRNKKGYDPLAEYTSMQDPIEFTDDILESMPDYSEAYSDANLASIAASSAYEAVYGEAPSTSSEDPRDINNISPNTNYKDANDNDICGEAITVASF